MEAKRYINKYRIDKKDYFSHKEFMKDFKNDFDILVSDVVEKNNGITGDQYHQCINTMRELWKEIDKKSKKKLPEKLWGYFYSAIALNNKYKTCKDVITT